MIAETHDFHVIQFSQRHVDRQFIGNFLRRNRERIRNLIERMHRSYQRPLRVRHVVNVRIHWIQTGRRRIRISRVTGQQNVILYVQQPAMSPVAGVKFLPVQKHRIVVRLGIALFPSVGDIRKALLLVHD